MSARRTDMHRLQDLVRYHRMGLGKHRIAHSALRVPMSYSSGLIKQSVMAGSSGIVLHSRRVVEQ